MTNLVFQDWVLSFLFVCFFNLLNDPFYFWGFPFTFLFDSLTFFTFSLILVGFSSILFLFWIKFSHLRLTSLFHYLFIFVLLEYICVFYEMFEYSYRHSFEFFVWKSFQVIFIRCHFYNLWRRHVVLVFHAVSVSALRVCIWNSWLHLFLLFMLPFFFQWNHLQCSGEY